MKLSVWVVVAAVFMPTGAQLAETLGSSSVPAVGIVQTTARLGQFCNKGHLQFLPDDDLALSDAAHEWAASRRFIVRYSAEEAMVTIIPPRTGDVLEVRDSLKEITFLMININECPDDARGIPTSVSVERLDIVNEGDKLDFRVAPY